LPVNDVGVAIVVSLVVSPGRAHSSYPPGRLVPYFRLHYLEVSV